AVVGPFQSDGHGQAAVQWAGTSPGVQSHRNSTVMSHAVVYGGQSSYQVTRGGPDGTGRPPREWTSLYQGTTYGASGYKSHIHAMERPVPIVPASPRPATSKSHSGNKRRACLGGCHKFGSSHGGMPQRHSTLNIASQ